MGRNGLFELPQSLQRNAQIDVDRSPLDRAALTAHFLERFAKGDGSLFEFGRAPPPRIPMAFNAEPKLYWVAAHSSGTRSRVLSLSASRKATTASSSLAVPTSRSPRTSNAEPGLLCIVAHWS